MKIISRNIVLLLEISRQNKQNKSVYFQSVSKTELPQNRAKTGRFATECNQNATCIACPLPAGKPCIVAYFGQGKGKPSAPLAHITGNLAHALPALSLRPWTPTKAGHRAGKRQGKGLRIGQS